METPFEQTIVSTGRSGSYYFGVDLETGVKDSGKEPMGGHRIKQEKYNEIVLLKKWQNPVQ